MRGREPIMPQRRRRIPRQFSWIDHRLVRDGHIQERSTSALALYLFLVTVADAEGLSWYSQAALCCQLSLSSSQLQSAGKELQQAGLIAYREPLYQVLDLAPSVPPAAPRYGGEARSVNDILRNIMGGVK
ncbi:MAG: helix-turn-helix domain-containing protein [Deltaproteobacteria bacterium]